ncbi:hypothetical protein CEXT_308571 [Caerostris extrusa]|uniref:Uncharacterized protein n=1 Tax=Caerostris extrusa TaxID=172846 RepID=A0AAV4PX24_CAEEX|nr:hypothetical protein CEXT_308571 [Caerostris extrusa]
MLQAEDGSSTESNPVHCGTAMISALMTSAARYKSTCYSLSRDTCCPPSFSLFLLQTGLRDLGHGFAGQPLLLQHRLVSLQVRLASLNE